MKIASTAKPTGYSGMGGAVTVRSTPKVSGSSQDAPAQLEFNRIQYAPGLSEEVGTFSVKLPATTEAVFSKPVNVNVKHAPVSILPITLSEGLGQLSVPVIVKLLPCVMVTLYGETEMLQKAYAEGSDMAQIIVRARIEMTVTAMSLNL